MRNILQERTVLRRALASGHEEVAYDKEFPQEFTGDKCNRH
jgi:hypothetical protein